eukprot:2780049-Amphidinium_carterae.4
MEPRIEGSSPSDGEKECPKKVGDMQTSISQFAVNSAGTNVIEREEDVARQRQSCAEHLRLAWPIPPKGKNVVGRPSRQDQFTRLLRDRPSCARRRRA